MEMNNTKREGDLKMDRKIHEDFKKKMGFTPPGIMVAENFGEEFSRRLADFHGDVWSEEGAIPLKYRHLMALATAVFEGNDKRSRLEIVKSMNEGATRKELMEVFKQQVWMKGSPVLVQIAPLIEMIDQKLGTKQTDL